MSVFSCLFVVAACAASPAMCPPGLTSDEMVMLSPAPGVLAPPEVMLQVDGVGILRASDRPSQWTAVKPQELFVSVELPPLPIDYVEVWLDNQPLQPIYNRSWSTTLDCPAPGKHLLQARYLSEGQWSLISPPLCFEVLLPTRPQIVGLGEPDLAVVPVTAGQEVPLKGGCLLMRLAHAELRDQVVAYLDDDPNTAVKAHRVGDCCSYHLNLNGVVSPGRHKLTVRVSPYACQLASEASRAVFVHYNPENIYTARRKSASRKRCKHCDSDKRVAPCLGDFVPEVLGNPAPSDGVLPTPSPSDQEGDADSNTAPTGSRVPAPAPILEENLSGRSATGSAREASRMHASEVRLVSFQNDPPEDEEALEREPFRDLFARLLQEAFGWMQELAGVEPPAHCEDVAAKQAKALTPVEQFVFYTSAWFPDRRFGLRGQSLDGEGLVIYEDMNFESYKDGSYAVRFNTNYPKVPATLRLQLSVQMEENGAWYPLTLPPIYIQPYNQTEHCSSGKATADNQACGGNCTESGSGDGQPSCTRHEVVCRGKSFLLESKEGHFCRVRRDGTARLGYDSTWDGYHGR